MTLGNTNEEMILLGLLFGAMLGYIFHINFLLQRCRKERKALYETVIALAKGEADVFETDTD